MPGTVSGRSVAPFFSPVCSVCGRVCSKSRIRLVRQLQGQPARLLEVHFPLLVVVTDDGPWSRLLPLLDPTLRHLPQHVGTQPRLVNLAGQVHPPFADAGHGSGERLGFRLFHILNQLNVKGVLLAAVASFGEPFVEAALGDADSLGGELPGDAGAQIADDRLDLLSVDERDRPALPLSAQNWLRNQADDEIKASAARITADLRRERVSLSDEESELADGVREVIDHLVAYCGYAANTGHDVYAFGDYMPLLVARAIQDKRNITGLRSFSLVLPVIGSPEFYMRARSSFAGLRRAIEDYQAALVGGVDDDVHNAYTRLDAARESALRAEFDNADRRELVTMTCLMTTVGAAWQRHFLPDDHFHLSLAMQHWQWLTTDQVRAFQTLLNTVLLAVRDLGADGRLERTLLASCACQPLLDFVVMSQSARLGIPEPANGHRTIGQRWGDIKRELPTAGGSLGKSLLHIGKIVIDRRNGLAHPAQQPNSVQQSRGEMLADLCRLVDFIRFLDCSMPP